MNDVVAAGARARHRLGQPPHRRRARPRCAPAYRRLHLPPAGRHRAVARRPRRADGHAPPCSTCTRSSAATCSATAAAAAPKAGAHPGRQRRHRPRHRARGADRRAVAQGPGGHLGPRRSRRRGLRALAVHDRRQAAAVRRAAAHAGHHAVPARTAPRCPRSATRSTCGSATPPRRSTASSSPEPERYAGLAGRRRRRSVHRVVRAQDVAGHDRDEVELGGHPDHDRQPVEAGVAAAAGRQVAAEVPPDAGEVEQLAGLPDQLVAPARPGQHRQRQQPQDVLRRVDLVDQQEAGHDQEAELGEPRRLRGEQADREHADAPGTEEHPGHRVDGVRADRVPGLLRPPARGSRGRRPRSELNVQKTFHSARPVRYAGALASTQRRAAP